ncbi:MAG: YidC/Oxa1 family membrane protein insertase, partial [Elusimicrobiota bacterium]|nr:YidC/Oxa1 family membrane protein insertase [Elusimicrobiota bacterium]
MSDIASFFRFVLTFLYSITDSYGLSIILLSLLISAFLIPFYYLAFKLEQKEKLLQSKIQPKMKLIALVPDSFTRHKLLQRLYFYYSYSPLYSLRSLSSLLIQIPFFIAAYKALDNFEVLKGISFFFIKDLGQPDMLLAGVNLLPILMTIFNILSAILITSPNSKERKQSYIIAVFFLILLYTSPAALVLYWTMSNLINMLRYFISWLKNNGIKTFFVGTKKALVGLINNPQTSAFLLLVSLYFTINTLALGGGDKYFLTIILISLYLATVVQICNFVRLDYSSQFLFNSMQISFSLKGKGFLAIKVIALIMILFFISFFPYEYERPHYLIAIVTLISICDFKNIKVGLKKCLHKISLPVMAMLFPLMLYIKSNWIYLDAHSLTILCFSLILFSILLPIIAQFFNSKLSFDKTIIISTSFILSAIFLPLVRDITRYSGYLPIDFIVLFAVILFIISLLEKYKKVLILFFMIAFLIIFVLSIPTFIKENVSNKPTAQIPQDLLEMEMKDKPSIYLLMHDSFPHKDLADYLKLESYDGLVEFLKEQGFEIYNVYSLRDSTEGTMSSIFELVRYVPIENLARIWFGDNRVNLLLRSKGYKTGTNRGDLSERDFLSSFFDFSLSIESSTNDNYVLLAILQGRLNSMLFSKTLYRT